MKEIAINEAISQLQLQDTDRTKSGFVRRVMALTAFERWILNYTRAYYPHSNTSGALTSELKESEQDSRGIELGEVKGSIMSNSGKMGMPYIPNPLRPIPPPTTSNIASDSSSGSQQHADTFQSATTGSKKVITPAMIRQFNPYIDSDEED